MKNMRGDFRSIGRMKNNFFICISEKNRKLKKVAVKIAA